MQVHRRFFLMVPVVGFLSLSALALADTVPATQSGAPSDKSHPPALSQTDAKKFASEMLVAADEIASSYAQPVEMKKLAAYGILSLYAVTETPLPDHLRGDPEKLFEGKKEDLLFEEIWKARAALGNSSLLSFHHRRDVRLSIQAMLSTLDPYSLYLSLEESMRYSQRGQSNIGILLEEREPDGPCIVQTVAIGGPAQKAGILPGDELLAVNDQPIPRKRVARLVVQDLDGPPESEVTLTIRSLHEPKPRQVKVARNFIREDGVSGHRLQIIAGEPSWEFVLGTRERIALVRIGALTAKNEIPDGQSTVEQLREVLLALQRDGLAGFVLDLRDCPGGAMDGAIQVTSEFIPEGVLAQARYRKREKTQYPALGDGSLYRTPMVVLVGPQTMGGGELIAAALQDYRRAIIVGQRTRGKASIQTPETISTRGRANLQRSETIPTYPQSHPIRLTTGFFVRPKGGNLNRFANSKPSDEWGVQPDPDCEVRLPPVMLRQVRQWRLQQDLGSIEARQPLPLDRLENDPVLHAGVQILLKKK